MSIIYGRQRIFISPRGLPMLVRSVQREPARDTFPF
jgi:hypothetical protein